MVWGRVDWLGLSWGWSWGKLLGGREGWQRVFRCQVKWAHGADVGERGEEKAYQHRGVIRKHREREACHGKGDRRTGSRNGVLLSAFTERPEVPNRTSSKEEGLIPHYIPPSWMNSFR